MQTPKQHYVARVVIERATAKQDSGTTTRGNVPRKKAELASITIRRNTLAELQAALGQHINLVDDFEGDTDE